MHDWNLLSTKNLLHHGSRNTTFSTTSWSNLYICFLFRFCLFIFFWYNEPGLKREIYHQVIFYLCSFWKVGTQPKVLQFKVIFSPLNFLENLKRHFFRKPWKSLKTSCYYTCFSLLSKINIKSGSRLLVMLSKSSMSKFSNHLWKHLNWCGKRDQQRWSVLQQ